MMIIIIKHHLSGDIYQSHAKSSLSVKLKILVCLNEVIMTSNLKTTENKKRFTEEKSYL